MTLAACETYKPLHNHPKWGFVIYRCDYRDDSAWALFMDRWSQRVNERLVSMNEKQLAKTLEFTVREDRASLDGATVEDVRKLFAAWAETEEAAAERQAASDRQAWSSPRWTFCVHVDAESLDECLRYDTLPENIQRKFFTKNRDSALGQAAYVNVVNAVPVEGSAQQDDEEESEEEEDAVSFKAHWPLVIPDMFDSFNRNPDLFHTYASDCDRDGVFLG